MVVAFEEVVRHPVEDIDVVEVVADNFCRQTHHSGIHRHNHRNREELNPVDLEDHEVDHIDRGMVVVHHIVEMVQDKPWR